MSASAAVEDSRSRDFVFDDHDFGRVRELIYGFAGIALSAAKRDMVYSRLSRRLRTLGLEDFGAYLDIVESNDAAEIEAFTNALTTNLTAFFREAHHFPIFAEHLTRNSQPQTVWCSAASTGEEPYTIAMTAVETFGTFDPPVRILASDVDTNVLATAEAGVYTDDRIAKLEPERLKRFFKRGSGVNANKVRVRDELRRLITFRQINLLEDGWPVRGPLDVIFCRNVMIYFDRPTQLAILERFAPVLRNDGLLFAGHSESFQNATHLFKLRGKTVYGLAGSNHR